MKLFGRTGGYYLFWSGFAYFVASIICITWFKEIEPQFVTLAWIIVMMLPLVVPQIGRYFNMQPFFGENSMWRKREIGDRVSKDIDDTNVLKFPDPKALPRLKAVEPSESELDASRSPYTIGINHSGNIQFNMRTDYGTTTLTMNEQGVIDLIEDLAHFIRKTHTVTITEK
jgi:hypothetical protein